MDYLYLARAIGAGRAAQQIPRWSITTLRAVADGKADLRAVRHPLGFACLPVLRDGDYGICIHAWLSDYQPVTAVHAHCWDLTSYVLFGQLRNELPVVRETRPAAYRVLEVRSRGDTDEIVPTARLVSCAPGTSQVNGDGDVYTVRAGTFHNSAVAPGSPTATVALGKMVAGGTDLSLGGIGAAPYRVRRVRCDRAQTAAIARAVIDRLGAHA